MKQYWGKGDRGTTDIYNKEVDKSSLVIELLGSVDEVSAHLGYLVANLESFSQQKVQLSEILNDLFTIGSVISEVENIEFDFRRIRLLETWIKEINDQVPPLKKFVKPIGNKTASIVNIARSVTRKSEVIFFKYYEIEKRNEDIGSYLNRLSDYLFVLMRLINDKFGLEEYY